MSKLSFRARALDTVKPMPVYRAEEIPDLPDFAAINRAVPQMPTGMEKEEESEHHLQRAMSAQQVYGETGRLIIPTPDVYEDIACYECLYESNYKPAKQLIHIQGSLNMMDQEMPDYDMDSEDETWLNKQKKKMEITPLQFEEMIDRLEKGSGQQVVTDKEAKLLLKEDDDLILAVYDYWLNKRLKMKHALIPQVKTEKRDGSTTNNPYVAFRRRTEKMQTRKNRKNDEASYEKMLKLRRDLSRAVTILEMVKRREKTKREHLHLTLEIVEQRYQMGDFSGTVLAEVNALKDTRPSFLPFVNRHDWRIREYGVSRKKREYRKRKSKQQQVQARVEPEVPSMLPYDEVRALFPDIASSDDEMSPVHSQSDLDEDAPDGQFMFRRKKGCSYHAPLIEKPGNWPWFSQEDGGLGDKRYRYTCASLRYPSRCIGMSRRRVGRGGRIWLDRGYSPMDDHLSALPTMIAEENAELSKNRLSTNHRLGDYHRSSNSWMHFRPKTPSPTDKPSSLGVTSSLRNSPVTLTTVSTPEFMLESFQTHQAELLEMQRKQLEQTQDDKSPVVDISQNLAHSQQPTLPPLLSRLTLDSATAQFAASAVVDTAPSSGTLGSNLSAAPAAVSDRRPCATTVSLQNGPRDGHLPSTAPSTPVLQLNYPLSFSSRASVQAAATATIANAAATPSPNHPVAVVTNAMGGSAGMRVLTTYKPAMNPPVVPVLKVATPAAGVPADAVSK
ncbi:PREDICTED: enhancer of polycomb homolog 1-like [Priapulus caudatus]|uniref:Enhancer of polycomb-like protein n=1 Tax=Priapulus caudatus TaxID=37621 RepID=A0ABM1E1N1_PRICU|nr:PREDICTED: enhancer of polycomb homolog 1-like [Priapulus caudatus]